MAFSQGQPARLAFGWVTVTPVPTAENGRNWKNQLKKIKNKVENLGPTCNRGKNSLVSYVYFFCPAVERNTA